MHEIRKTDDDGGCRMLKRASLRNVRGFSMIELMVALVLSLLVAGAVLALVLAIIKSNRMTLQATRLNQELRATLAVVAADIRRARSVDDPLSSAMLGPNPIGAVSTATASCIIYAYDGAAGGRWHLMKLNGGRVRLEAFADRPTAGDCNSANGEIIGSRQVEVTSMTFTPTTTTSTPPLATDETVVRQFTVTVTGRLVDNDPDLVAATRTMTSTVYVRSVGAGI